MQNYFSSDFKLGILGGGQLGKMLLYDTRKFDITTHVLDSNPAAPSAIACDQFVCGDIQDYDTVVAFGKAVDLITFEIEAVNLKALKALEEMGKTVYPSAETLELIQSKQRQKNFYKQNDIPTSPFINFESLAALKSAYQKGQFTLPQVWKVATGGYDGKGVQMLRTEKDFDKLPDAACLVEEMIDFEMELAVIVARNPSGETQSYPVVEMEFHPEANQVEYVLSPARISEEIEQKARALAEKVSGQFAHVGLLAIELFLTKAGDVLVNEVAPRPHNSGHLTIEGCYTNQFEQHLRAILDLPLGDSSTKKPAVMVNLVGEENYEGQVYYQNIDEIFALKGVTPHIYGKKETRPFRKMGHVTIINESIEEARAMAEKVKKQLKVISDEKI
ncbi:MAG: 5-(carboxyamino)imidazole ribonucleotide synthase [Psychroflexus sp.]|nr:5-(carboxyamino)imidazole ribonucleotide synthase [Psychroflexus sp.]MDN6310532.1 5-(carboxyamino)imidazole ribonucleotide synthase [Psychroflexus sp.]